MQCSMHLLIVRNNSCVQNQKKLIQVEAIMADHDTISVGCLKVNNSIFLHFYVLNFLNYSYCFIPEHSFKWENNE